jgi:protein-disulfide isomerase
MENKNNLIVGILVAAIALLTGLGLVFGVGIAVQSTVTPINGSLQMILANQTALEKRVESAANLDMDNLKKRITELESTVGQLKMMIATAPARQQPTPQPSAQQAPPQEDMNKVYDLPIASSYVYGKPTAPATITVFNDYQCPYCARFYPAAHDVVKAMPDKVKLVLKHFPLGFHPNAKPAAKAALAAGLQGKFYEMSDLLYANAASLSDDKYKELAKQLGLNLDKFSKDLKEKDAEFEKKIKEDEDLAEKSDVRGTPTYFLNGKKAMARDLDSWKKEVEAATRGTK